MINVFCEEHANNSVNIRGIHSTVWAEWVPSHTYGIQMTVLCAGTDYHSPAVRQVKIKRVPSLHYNHSQEGHCVKRDERVGREDLEDYLLTTELTIQNLLSVGT